MDEYLRLTPAPGGAVSERMQALLSKAVEEQVHEQREVQSLLSDVRSALAEVQRDARVVPAASDGVREELAAHAEETRGRLAQLDERLQAIVGAVSTSAQVLQGISGQLERLVEQTREQASNAGRSEPLAQIRHEVAELRAHLDTSAEQTAMAVASHVDNAVLVLAEALLRRPVGSVSTETAAHSEPVAAAARDAETQLESPSEFAPEPERAQQPEPELEPESESESEPEPASEPEPKPEPAPEGELVLELRHATVDEQQAEAIPIADDDPLFGSRFRVPPAVDDDDEAGALVDGDRGGPDDDPAVRPEAIAGVAAPYDDLLGDLPSSDEPRPAFPLAQAPYDLERALFGDRSRPFMEQQPGDDGGDEATVPTTERGDTGHEPAQAQSGAPAEVAGSSEGSAEEEEPRRRPWWRPSG